MILTKSNIDSFDLYGEIDDYIKSGKSEEVLIIVPTNRKLRSLKKDLIDLSPHQTVSHINIETLSTLSTNLLTEIAPFIQLSEAASSVFIKESAEETKLNYFTNYSGNIPDGTLDRIKNVISEYKKHGISPDVLLKEAEKLSVSEKLKAIDIANIYSLFETKTEAINALEIGDVYKILLDSEVSHFKKVFDKLFHKLKLIGLLGFDEFTIPEIEIINRISECSSAKLFIDFDYYDYNPLVFSHLTETRKNLEKFGFEVIRDDSVYELTEFNQFIRANLFLKNKSRSEKFSDKIVKMEGRTKEEEVELIAKQIKYLLTEEEVQPHKICVVFNLISEYSSLVRDVFERIGIPFNLTDRIPLEQSPPVIALVNFLDIAVNDYYFKNIFRALSGRYFEHSDIDVANLNYVASELKIVSGLYNWKNSINNSIGKTFGDEDKISDRKLKKAISDLEQIENKLAAFSGKLTPSEFFNQLLVFIKESRISSSVLESSEESREANIVGLTTFIETIEEILKLIDLQNEGKQYDLNFYTDQIKTACGWARFNVKGRSDYGVLVTSVNEIRGLKFDHLFIAGLNEGVFPTRYNPEIFFSGAFAKKEITHQTEERFHFYQSLTSWRKRLYLSCSLTGNEKELVESNFLSDFCELFDHKFLTKDNFKNSAYNIEDVHMNIGKRFLIDGQIDANEGIGKEDLEELKRKIRISTLRTNEPQAKNKYNSYLDTSQNKIIEQTLDAFKEREYSITQLETYAKCPFKYFMQYVLGLSQISEPTEEVEAIEIGSVLHKILYEFYSEVRNRNIKISGCSKDKFKELTELIFTIGEENLSSPIFASEISFYEKERILGINGNREESILYQFLIKEREEESDDPSYFEVAFGDVYSKIKDEELSSKEPVQANELKFKGKIDRIDVDHNESTFSVVDYKLSLGSRPTLNDISSGISLQLPLYLFAAKKLFERNEIELSPNEVYLYSLKFTEKDFGKTKISLVSKKVKNRKEELENLLNETIEKIEGYVENIVKGGFPLTSLEDREKKVCGYCDFRKICRIDETEL